MVTFESVDTKARTATFNVNGTFVTRPIADGVGDEQLADHLRALAEGLAIEHAPTPKLAVAALPFKPGDVLAGG